MGLEPVYVSPISHNLARAAMTLLAVLFCLTGAMANELTVNDGTNSSNSVPVYGTWCDAYLKCEFVIPASQLSEMENGIISKMSFFVYNISIISEFLFRFLDCFVIIGN